MRRQLYRFYENPWRPWQRCAGLTTTTCLSWEHCRLRRLILGARPDGTAGAIGAGCTSTEWEPLTFAPDRVLCGQREEPASLERSPSYWLLPATIGFPLSSTPCCGIRWSVSRTRSKKQLSTGAATIPVTLPGLLKFLSPNLGLDLVRIPAGAAAPGRSPALSWLYSRTTLWAIARSFRSASNQHVEHDLRPCCPSTENGHASSTLSA
jgi:hypothetical protein